MRILDTLFIDDYYYNHNWQSKKLNTTEKTKYNRRNKLAIGR